MATVATIPATLLGRQLRKGRESTGLSTRAVARELQGMGLKMSHATICNYEKGVASPCQATLEAMRTLYGLPKSWPLQSAYTISGARYRCLKSVRVRDKHRYTGEASGWFRAYFAAEEILDEVLAPTHPDFAVRANESGPDIAKSLRNCLGLGDHPVPSVIQLLEAFGIRVIQVSTSARIDEIAGYFNEAPIVVINPSLSNDRIRLNAAHALGHHLFKDCCKRRASLGEKETESRAFEFASHLLLPEKVLRQALELQSMVRLVQFKERFGISLAAMIYRARKTELIPKSLYEHLWITFGRLGWRQEEPGRVASDRPVRMEVLIDSAVNKKKMTYADVAHLAAVDEPVVLQRVINAMGGSLDVINGTSRGRIIRLDSYRAEQMDEVGE